MRKSIARGERSVSTLPSPNVWMAVNLARESSNDRRSFSDANPRPEPARFDTGLRVQSSDLSSFSSEPCESSAAHPGDNAAFDEELYRPVANSGWPRS